ncbi:MAG TPA: hypothetical protein VMD29_02985 [Terracidiphilus sp.]|nr:hypothetical protein [Terracidiphilus sp.]
MIQPDSRCAAGLPLLALLLCGFQATNHAISIPVIVTAAPVYDALAGLRGGERFPRGAQLLRVEDGAAAPLVAGFAASADANLSFDAQRVLFAGKKSADDPWSIWELTLSSRSLRQVIGGASDAVRPMYLPGDRLVYAHRTQSGFRIEAAGLDGTHVLPLTYTPGNALPDDVLYDGRILFESGFPLGSGATPEMFLVYSDGSGVESYRCDHGTARWGGRQLASGDVVFTHGATLARFTSPLANEAPVTAPRADYAGAIAELASGDWLVSARPGPAGKYALKVWKPGTPLLRTVFARDGEDLVEPVLVAPRERPNKHPSGLHDWNYANLLALDARQSREGIVKGSLALVRVQALDPAGNTVELGEAPVEADGSFFVQTPADRPIRFVLLDAHGAVLRQEHGWFWARRGEQRICVGCHTGPERASENRVPAVLLHTTTPVALNGIGSQPNAEGR